MSKSRASIFGDEPTPLDVASFTPKASVEAKGPAVEEVRAISQAAKFTSREPAIPKPETSGKRPKRKYMTGRNVQFNIKAKLETVDAFYALTDEQGWVLGFTLQRAVEALQRELTSKES